MGIVHRSQLMQMRHRVREGLVSIQKYTRLAIALYVVAGVCEFIAAVASLVGGSRLNVFTFSFAAGAFFYCAFVFARKLKNIARDIDLLHEPEDDDRAK